MPSALSAIRYLLSTGNWQLGTGNQPLATRRSMGVTSASFGVRADKGVISQFFTAVKDANLSLGEHAENGT